MNEFLDANKSGEGSIDFGEPTVSREENQMVLIRALLGLKECHDPVYCVRILFDEGREAFEKMRGPV